MKKHIVLFLTLLASITVNPVWTMKKEIKNNKNISLENPENTPSSPEFSMSTDTDELIEIACHRFKVPYLKYKDKKFLIYKKLLSECMLHKAEENFCNKANTEDKLKKIKENSWDITDLIRENFPEAKEKDLQRFIDLAQGKTSPKDEKNNDDLFKDAKLADLLGHRRVYKICSETLLLRNIKNLKNLPGQQICSFKQAKGIKIIPEKLKFLVYGPVSEKLQKMELWNIQTGKREQTFQWKGGPGISGVKVLSESKVLCIGDNDTNIDVNIFNLETGSCEVNTKLRFSNTCHGVKVSPDKKQFALCNLKEIVVYSLETREKQTLVAGKTPFEQIYFSSDSKQILIKMFLFSEDAYKLYDIKTRKLPSDISDFNHLFFTVPGTETFLSKEERDVVLKNKKRKTIKRFSGHKYPPKIIKIIPGTTRFLSFDYDKFKLWDMKSGQCLLTFSSIGGFLGQKNIITPKKIFSYEKIGKSKFYRPIQFLLQRDGKTGEKERKFFHDSGVKNAKYLPETKQLLSCDGIGNVWLFDISPLENPTISQLELIHKLHKNSITNNQPISFNKNDHETFCELPKSVKAKIVDLGWVEDKKG